MPKPAPLPTRPAKAGAHPPEVKTRLLTAAQTTGRIGKSTLLTTLATWASFAEVTWAGVDADPANHTFSDIMNSRPDSQVASLPINQPQALDAIFRHADTAPISLVDFPAGSTEQILDHIDRKRTLEGFEQKGVRMTVFLFASPDDTAEASMKALVLALRGRADFVVVRNDARFSSERFERSKAARTLADLGAPVITMPSISTFTFREIAAAEASLQRTLALPDALPHVGIDSRLDIEFFLNQLYTQFEDHADKLLPTGVKPRKFVARRTTAEVPRGNRFSDPLDF